MNFHRNRRIAVGFAAVAAASSAVLAGSVSAGPNADAAAQNRAIEVAAVRLTSFPLADASVVARNPALHGLISALDNAQAAPARVLGRRGGPFQATVVPLSKDQYCLTRGATVDCVAADGLAPFTAFAFDEKTGQTTLEVVAPGGIQSIVAVNSQGQETPVSVTDGTGVAKFDGDLAKVTWVADGSAQSREFAVGIARGPQDDR